MSSMKWFTVKNFEKSEFPNQDLPSFISTYGIAGALDAAVTTLKKIPSNGQNLPLIEWNSGYSIGHAPIDEQHKKLISLINDFAIFYNHKASGAVTPIFISVAQHILGEILEYTVYHFSYEETFMKKASFPEKDYHMKEHSDFATYFTNNFKAKLMSGNFAREDIKDGYSYLCRWLNTHILKSDMKLRPYLQNEK